MQDSYFGAFTCNVPTHIYILIHGPTLSFSLQGFSNLITQSLRHILIPFLPLSSRSLHSSLKPLVSLQLRSPLIFQKGQSLENPLSWGPNTQGFVFVTYLRHNPENRDEIILVEYVT
jgi:hypothetical protein